MGFSVPEGYSLGTPIDHFTVVCSVAWLLNESEAGFHLVLTEHTCFSYHVNDAVLLCNKSSEASIKRWSTPASVSLKGQAT